MNRGQRFVWLSCLIPTVLGTLAVATLPITLSGKLAAAAGVWLAYIAIAGFVAEYVKEWS